MRLKMYIFLPTENTNFTQNIVYPSLLEEISLKDQSQGIEKEYFVLEEAKPPVWINGLEIPGCISGSGCKNDHACIIANDCCASTIEKIDRMFPDGTKPLTAFEIYKNITDAILPSIDEVLVELFLSRSRCYQLNKTINIQMIDDCPKYDDYFNTAYNESVTYLCHNSFVVPVSLFNCSILQIVYKNMFCAMCHGVAESEVIEWTTKARCTSKSEQQFLTDLANGVNTCNLLFEEPNTNVRHRRCNANYKNPNFEQNKRHLRDCYFCQLYVLPIGAHNDTLYKNPHCMLCDGLYTLEETKAVIGEMYSECFTNQNMLTTEFMPHLPAGLPTNILRPTIPTAAPENFQEKVYVYTYNLNMLFKLNFKTIRSPNIHSGPIFKGADIGHGLGLGFGGQGLNASNATDGNKTHRYLHHNGTHRWRDQFGFITINIVMKVDFLSIGLVSVSCICLFVLIVGHVVLPEMRNFHGKTLMSFSISLFFAQFCFLLGSIKDIPQTVCMVIACLCHYFWLCTFLWSTVMAFDIARRFSVCLSLRQRIGATDSDKRFFVYSTITWSCSFIYVTAAAVADVVLDGTIMGYGMFNICWITQNNGLMFGFAFPVLVLTVLNVICFVSALYGIEKQKRVMKRETRLTKKRRVHCLSYTRISLLLGMAWMFAFLSAWLELTFMSYLSVALNGLQGFFLCFSTILSPRIRGLIKARHSHQPKQLSDIVSSK